MNCLLVVAINLIYTQNFPLRPESFGTTLVFVSLAMLCHTSYVIPMVVYNTIHKAASDLAAYHAGWFAATLSLCTTWFTRTHVMKWRRLCLYVCSRWFTRTHVVVVLAHGTVCFGSSIWQLIIILVLRFLKITLNVVDRMTTGPRLFVYV